MEPMTASTDTEVALASTRPAPAIALDHSQGLDSPLLSVVIVNFRQWRNTARLVRHLRDSDVSRCGAAEIVIVDNHSPYHSIRKRLRRTPGVSLRCLRQNRGFGRGVNEGCRLSRGRWFLLLNPDVSVPPGFLDQALAQVDRFEPRAGIVGLQLRDPDGSLQGSAGDVPTFLGTLLGLLRPRKRRKCRPLPVKSALKTQWVTGCGMLIRRECFERLGGFDHRFFLYYEDADLCRRAWASGWSVWHQPAVRMIHHHPLHSRPVPPRTRLLTRHALLVFAQKHWPAWQMQVLALLILIQAIVLKRRLLRRMAWDMLLGRRRAACRRVCRLAQTSHSREGVRVESQHARGRKRHERRLLPR
jgi:N-acetylglucosaminyl-diphospho-decaprenol L-rhamnosyltransferase